MPYLAGNVGGPPPLSEREERLNAEIDRLKRRLDAARGCRDALVSLVAALNERDLKIAEWTLVEQAERALAAYDKVTGEAAE